MSSAKSVPTSAAATNAAASSAAPEGAEKNAPLLNGGTAAGNKRGDNAAVANALASIEAEFNKHPDRNSWNRFYQEIRDKCYRESKEQDFTTIESERPQNRCLNRYRDVNPYDHSRIKLQRGNVDYINANLVELPRAERRYILTQGPLSETVSHFWLMVWEHNTRAILMLNKLIEKKQVKCHLYWPEERGEQHALHFKDIKLTVEFLKQEQYKNYVRRLFKLTDLETKTSREIVQFHYTTWPDFGIPSSPDAFLQFLKQVRDSGALNRDVGPCVVHCSAGIGRSGTFCLVDCCLVLVDKLGKCDVSQVLCELRSYRMGLIQTADQLYFSYQAIIEGIKLLKDPNFLNYKEEPMLLAEKDIDTIAAAAAAKQNHALEETPPPLPPRIQSLQQPQQLPMAPNSGGILGLHLNSKQNKTYIGEADHDDDDDDDDIFIPNIDPQTTTTTNGKHSKDALNNFISMEQKSFGGNAAGTDANRPLPPLPPHAHAALDRVHETNASDSDYDEDDMLDDNDNEHNDVANNDDDDEIDTDLDNDNDEHADNVNKKLQNDDVNANKEQQQQQQQQQQQTTESSKTNGIERSLSPENELKRRKRTEYQANLEQKVNEIKRKQRESDDGKQAAKKRRSLLTYIAAGVVVGCICVYAYSKLG